MGIPSNNKELQTRSYCLKLWMSGHYCSKTASRRIECRIAENPYVYLSSMADNGTLLCIHRDPAQLRLLQENGYELVTATNGSEGLRLLMTRSVDAIVLEDHLGLLDGATVATEIQKVKHPLPIV